MLVNLASFGVGLKREGSRAQFARLSFLVLLAGCGGDADGLTQAGSAVRGAAARCPERFRLSD